METLLQISRPLSIEISFYTGNHEIRNRTFRKTSSPFVSFFFFVEKCSAIRTCNWKMFVNFSWIICNSSEKKNLSNSSSSNPEENYKSPDRRRNVNKEMNVNKETKYNDYNYKLQLNVIHQYSGHPKERMNRRTEIKCISVGIFLCPVCNYRYRGKLLCGSWITNCQLPFIQ